MKKVLTVQDISCVGKVSLTVALPILSAMGMSTSVIPTAVLSMHTGFSGYTFCDLSSQIRAIMAHWKDRGVVFDGIYTGFLGSAAQIEIMSELFASFGGAGSAITGVPYREDADRDFIMDLLARLRELGARQVILKGIGYIADQCGVFSYDARTGRTNEYFHELLPVKFNGTGDIFAAVAFGAIMRGKSLETAVRIAADFVVSTIKETMSDEERNGYEGVDFEVVIPELVRKI